MFVVWGLLVTSYSIISINLNALGALWGVDDKSQTRIAAIREAFSLLGLILAVSLPNLLIQVAPQGQIYQWFGLILAMLMLVALANFLNGIKLPVRKCGLVNPNVHFILI